MDYNISKILLYAQDNKGLGHINRTLIIVRHILAAHQNMVAYIVSKSPISTNFTLPERCDYIKLPTCLNPRDLQTEHEIEAAKQHFRALRSQLLLDTALGIAPDLVLVDHEPLGFAGEFREGLYALKAYYPSTRFVFGLRDIMDDPACVRAQWQEQGVYDAFENLYDGIAVYGCPELYDVADAYSIPPSARPKLHYCGYIVRDKPPLDSATVRRQYGVPQDARLLLATVGGGSDGYPVLDAVLKSLELLKTDFPGLCAVLVTGPFMPPREQAMLQAQATRTCRVLTVADTFQLMVAADAIVSMGGYNSICEALAVPRPLVIVPRATRKIEQKIRAEILETLGLARCLTPENLASSDLAWAIAWALLRPPLAHAAHVHQIIPSFNGAEQLTSYLSPWLAKYDRDVGVR